jgi:hypothetical protein
MPRVRHLLLSQHLQLSLLQSLLLLLSQHQLPVVLVPAQQLLQLLLLASLQHLLSCPLWPT